MRRPRVPNAPAGPYLRPSSFSGRRLNTASVLRVRSATRRAAARANPGRGRGRKCARMCAGCHLDVRRSPARSVLLVRSAPRRPPARSPRSPATTHRGGGSRRRRAERPRGELVSPPCARTRRRGHLAVRPGRRVMSLYGPPARVPLLTPRASKRGQSPSGCLRLWVPEALGVPTAGDRRRGGGRRHLAVRRRGGWLPRPAAVSPRASPRGGPAPGSARRGEGRSLVAARRPEARDGDLLRGRELLQPAGQRGEARRLLPQVTGPGPPPARPDHAPAGPGSAQGKLRPRGPARGALGAPGLGAAPTSESAPGAV